MFHEPTTSGAALVLGLDAGACFGVLAGAGLALDACARAGSGVASGAGAMGAPDPAGVLEGFAGLDGRSSAAAPAISRITTPSASFAGDGREEERAMRAVSHTPPAVARAGRAAPRSISYTPES